MISESQSVPNEHICTLTLKSSLQQPESNVLHDLPLVELTSVSRYFKALHKHSSQSTGIKSTHANSDGERSIINYEDISGIGPPRRQLVVSLPFKPESLAIFNDWLYINNNDLNLSTQKLTLNEESESMKTLFSPRALKNWNEWKDCLMLAEFLDSDVFHRDILNILIHHIQPLKWKSKKLPIANTDSTTTVTTLTTRHLFTVFVSSELKPTIDTCKFVLQWIHDRQINIPQPDDENIVENLWKRVLKHFEKSSVSSRKGSPSSAIQNQLLERLMGEHIQLRPNTDTYTTTEENGTNISLNFKPKITLTDLLSKQLFKLRHNDPIREQLLEEIQKYDFHEVCQNGKRNTVDSNMYLHPVWLYDTTFRGWVTSFRQPDSTDIHTKSTSVEFTLTESSEWILRHLISSINIKQQSHYQFVKLVTLYDMVLCSEYNSVLDPCFVVSEYNSTVPLFVELFIESLEYFSKRWMNFDLDILPSELRNYILKSRL
jgi:hypothetical protein